MNPSNAVLTESGEILLELRGNKLALAYWSHFKGAGMEIWLKVSNDRWEYCRIQGNNFGWNITLHLKMNLQLGKGRPNNDKGTGVDVPHCPFRGPLTDPRSVYHRVVEVVNGGGELIQSQLLNV